MSRYPLGEARVTPEKARDAWAECAAMLSQELTLARNALRLAASMVYCGEPMTPDAERVIRRGLGVRIGGEETNDE